MWHMEFSEWCAKDGKFLGLVQCPACFAIKAGLSEKFICKIFLQIVVKDFYSKSTFDWSLEIKSKLSKSSCSLFLILQAPTFIFPHPHRKSEAVQKRAISKISQPRSAVKSIWWDVKNTFATWKLLSFHTFEKKSQALRTAYQQNQLTKSS